MKQRGPLKHKLSRRDEAQAIKLLREQKDNPNAQAHLLLASRMERLCQALRNSC